MKSPGTIKTAVSAIFERHSLLCSAAVLLISALGTTVLSLALAIGTYDVQQFFGYFTHPLILLLNYLPVLLLQIILVAAFKRHSVAFFLTSTLILLPSIGNFFKIKTRFEPFTFADMGSVFAGLEVANKYQLNLNSRVLAAIVYLLLGSLVLALLSRFGLKVRSGAKRRLAVVLAALGLCVPLWFGVYANETLYMDNAYSNAYVGELTAQHNFIANGFVYPFLYSVSASADTAPEDYSEQAALELLGAYSNADIPAERRVNLFVLQLESFTDLRDLGFSCADPAAYAGLYRLKEESLSGMLIPNIIGGGTIETERSVLTGNFSSLSYNNLSGSYVHYLNDQGYVTTGGHPNKPDFYNRINVAEYLGFSEFLFNDYYNSCTGGKWNCDAEFLPEAFRLFREKCAAGEDVFSFNITLQGHGPYRLEDCNTEDRYCLDDSLSQSSRDTINAYLSLVSESQRILLDELEKLRKESYPVVVLVYGDHNPLFTDNAVYEECGIAYDMSSEDGFLRYYGTPYMIWANDSAKALLGRDFSGEGPTISPCYLMGLLFDELGWEGSAYMQFSRAVRETLPVIHRNGCYMENGVFTLQLSPQGEKTLQDYAYVQYYCKNKIGK